MIFLQGDPKFEVTPLAAGIIMTGTFVTLNCAEWRRQLNTQPACEQETIRKVVAAV